MNCVVKSLSLLTDLSIDELEEYFEKVPFQERYWSAILEQQGFQKVLVAPKPLRKRMTVAELCGLVSGDNLVLARCSHHVVAITNKTIHDIDYAKDLCVYHYYIK